MTPNRTKDLVGFYSLLDLLEKNIGGRRVLSQCSRKMDWPQRGVYFFMQDSEYRTDTGGGSRIVRVGTHALKSGSRTTLWNRLSQHKGLEKSGGGNHRGSIFRLIVGTALIEHDQCCTWGEGNTAQGEIRKKEEQTEQEVSGVIRAMPFIWLAANDEPGPDSLRGYIERNAIALLSNHKKESIDPPSIGWLGHKCNRTLVKSSGLWNQRHVEDDYDPAFLDKMALMIEETQEAT